MISIYADNFRGFRDTLIDFKDVNFLLGENSTGKTSLLSLFSLVNDNNFWFTHDFNSETVSLGYFDEIASSPHDDSFSVGFSLNNTFGIDKRKGGICYYLLTFRNQDNIPTLSGIRLHTAELDLSAVWNGTELKYGVVQREIKQLPFSDWVHTLPTIATNTAAEKNSASIGVRPILHAFLHAIQQDSPILKDGHPFIPIFFPHYMEEQVAWIAPIRAKPKRTYDSYKVAFSPEGDHAPYVLKNLLEGNGIRGKASQSALLTFGKESGLFNQVRIRSHGRGKTAPFEIYVQLGTRRFRISNVGYGVAQVLPIIIELLSRRVGTWFTIQQPEVHLHPKAQAALGSTIFEFSRSRKDRFLIETHSDYLVDRFRRELHDGTRDKPSAQILFCQRNASGNNVSPIEIGTDGAYKGDVPKEFREFFLDEQISLLGI